MTLKEWLDRTGKSSAQIAFELDLPQGTLSRYLNGSRIPRPDIMQRIHRVTDGQVTANDFYAPADAGASAAGS